MIIEDRRFLLLSGGAGLLAALAGMVLSLLGIAPVELSGAAKVLEAIIVVPIVLSIFVVCLSFLIHAFRNQNYGWLLAFMFLSFFAAYLYGLIVASNPTSD